MSKANPYQPPQASLADKTTNDGLPVKVLTIAKRQRMLLWVFATYLLTAVAATILAGVVPTTTLIGLVLLLLMLTLWFFAVRLYWCVYSKTVAVLLTVFSLLPAINLLLMLAASSRANRIMRQHGLKVGFMGVSAQQLQAYSEN